MIKKYFIRYAYEFLIAIAEPASRPAFIHEYVITQYSLYAAMVIRLTPELIKSLLLKLCKNKEIPPKVTNFIDENTKRYGSARLLLKNNAYFLHIFDTSILSELAQRSPEIFSKLKKIKNSQIASSASNELTQNREEIYEKKEEEGHYNEKLYKETDPEKLNEEFEKLTTGGLMKEGELEKEEEAKEIYEIIGNYTAVAKAFIERNIPLIEEYDFQENENNPNLMIELKPTTKIRFYQEKALSKVFISGKARSGVIVLPCGAGKTLVGITATSRVKKRTMIFCNTALAIQQWKNQFRLFTDVAEDKIICLTSKHVDKEKYDVIYLK